MVSPVQREHGDEQPAAREARHPVQCAHEVPLPSREIPDLPAELRIRPGGVAGRAHTPHREHVPDEPQVFGDRPADPDRQVPERPGLHLGENGVHRLEVGVLGPSALGRYAKLLAGPHQGDRKVPVDVGVHPGQRELRPFHASALSRLEEGGPCPRDRPRRGVPSGERVEVELGEDDIQPGESAGVGPNSGRGPLVNLPRHQQVEQIEPPHPVVGR